jgi:hypothetical protein
MTRLALVVLTLTACGNHTTSSEPAAKSTAEPAAKPTSAGVHLALGDATVYELVDRRWRKRDPPTRRLVLHADGTVEMINDKTDKPWMTFAVKDDGTVLAEGKPMATIAEHGITDAMTNRPVPLEIDGNTITVHIDKDAVKVVLATDGNITVVDRPDGNKWRIDAKTPEVMRTAFLVLALDMKTALD